ncbi:MAG: hypothetical protein JSS72_10180 [Armatimonadetes bacterium]|nr:hypothetical protein [Armatimonadota bacterium]
MIEVPSWWLVLSLIFFAINALSFLGMFVAIWKMKQAVEQMQPKVDDLVSEVKAVTVKVNDLTTTVNETVKGLSGHANSVAGSADLIASTAARIFERNAPLVMGVLSAIRIVSAVRGAKKDEKKRAQKELPRRSHSRD